MPRTRAYGEHPMVSHCLRVLEIVCWSERPLTVSEIGDRLDLTKSTAHQVLQVMKEHGLVVQKPKGPYRPGPKAHAIGAVIYRDEIASDKAEAVIDEIAKATSETALYALACPDWPGLLVISERETSHPIRLQSHIGKCIPESLFGITLANTDEKVRKAMPPEAYTTSLGDKSIDILSAAVRDKEGNIKGVLALLIPKDRIDKKKAETYTKLLEEKAAALAG
ncbi:MAG: helix-turn-helix domain-containing protein [Candidatus Coatesbacteria bacterium]|nr:helix-turn-helix domain-containing protein [Candidatus Coatesbacteria bacterium]